jgi:hypothetical protein
MRRVGGMGKVYRSKKKTTKADHNAIPKVCYPNIAWELARQLRRLGIIYNPSIMKTHQQDCSCTPKGKNHPFSQVIQAYLLHAH